MDKYDFAGGNVIEDFIPYTLSCMKAEGFTAKQRYAWLRDVRNKMKEAEDLDICGRLQCEIMISMCNEMHRRRQAEITLPHMLECQVKEVLESMGKTYETACKFDDKIIVLCYSLLPNGGKTHGQYDLNELLKLYVGLHKGEDDNHE